MASASTKHVASVFSFLNVFFDIHMGMGGGKVRGASLRDGKMRFGRIPACDRQTESKTDGRTA